MTDNFSLSLSSDRPFIGETSQSAPNGDFQFNTNSTAQNSTGAPPPPGSNDADKQPDSDPSRQVTVEASAHDWQQFPWWEKIFYYQVGMDEAAYENSTPAERTQMITTGANNLANMASDPGDAEGAAEAAATMAVVKIVSKRVAKILANRELRLGIDRARAARNALAAQLRAQPRKTWPATVTAGYNVKTGQVAARACGGGKCAEDHVTDALGGKKEDVRFTEATRTSHGGEVPVCERCEATYGRSQFPAGTRFKSDETKSGH
jgi:hypothetical protein